MTSPAELFYITLLSTGVLYACMLAFFNGWLGTKRANTQIVWNSEIILWIVLLLLVVTVIFRLLGPTALAVGAGTWFLIGAGNLTVVLIYLVEKLARHTLPGKIFWCVVALSIAVILYSLGVVILEIFAGSLTPTEYAQALETLLLLMSLILSFILLFNLMQSLWSSFLQFRRLDPQASERYTAQGVQVIEQSGEAGAEKHLLTLESGGSTVFDFGLRRIEDHGYKADLRVVRTSYEQPISVEVSNDRVNWEPCFLDETIDSDWDVPYLNSPWRYVRVSNNGSKATAISNVYDLD